MDTSDPTISFDENGVCNHCHTYDLLVSKRVYAGKDDEHRLNQLVENIKRDGRGREYDCVLGISGGVDSSYSAYIAKKYGLNPLAIHLDNGWNSELAVKNVFSLLSKLDIDLDTVVLDWEEFKDLQLSFLKASTPDIEIPSDHAIIAVLNQKAKEIGVKYVIYGTNVRTESHMPTVWSQGHLDWRYIKSVQDKFGTRKLETFPHFTLFDALNYYLTLKWVPILNYVDYNKTKAIDVLKNELDWRYYGGKHYESIYTRFYQGYILPKKFGYDKRRAHLSSLICSGEITREEALAELDKNPYEDELFAKDYDFLLSKFGLSEEEFKAIMNEPPRKFSDYPSYDNLFGVSLLRIVKRYLIR